jgi:hypothetical protein
MKSLKVALMLFGAALVFSSGALAGDSNKTTLQLAEKVNVDGKPLNPGTYKVEWDGTGPTVQVTILQGKQAVATFSAHLSEQASPNPDNAYGSDAQPDGSQTLTAIYVGGKKTVLELDHKEASGQSSNSESK